MYRSLLTAMLLFGATLGVVAAPSLALAVVEPSGSVTDPEGDAAPSPVNNPAPDLVSATVRRSGSDLLLQARFKPGTFNAPTTNVSFNLDVDRDPSTGSPGIDSGCVNDAGLIGTDFLVFVENGNPTAIVVQNQGGCATYALVGNAPVTFVADGVDVIVPLSLLGGSDGRLNFKVVTGDSSGVIDVMPDIGLAPGDSRSFVDVPSTHPFYAEIEALVASNFTGGCDTDPNLFCPDDPVTRGQIAVLLERAIQGGGFVPPPATGIFSDVPESSPFAPWIEQFFNDGYTQGCNTVFGPNTYCPDSPVTRGQLAVFVLRALAGPGYVPPAATGEFDDVPADDPFAPWIEELVRRGISVGCGPTTFCPAAPTPRKQVAALIARAFLSGP